MPISGIIKMYYYNKDKYMYKYVIFDLDGTLLNTLEDLASAGNYALRSLNLPIHKTEEYKYFVGNGIPMLIKRMSPDNCDEDTLKKIHDCFSEYYGKHCLDKTKPYDGISELLSKLGKDKIKIGVVTNKDHNFSVKLINDFFGSRVDIVCGRKDGTPKKPDPFLVNYEIDHFNADRKEVLYVGDSDVDMITAVNAGVDACGVLWGFRTEKELLDSGAKYIVSNPTELYDAVIN